ncbi:MAG: replicative DNA helicase [Elusimicrobia bacterium]|nr:replicative DNA helicase [Elusimicrobiota bacterium]
MPKKKDSINVGELLAPPYDIEAEKAILGAILIEGGVIYTVIEILGTKSEVFYDEKNRKIYDVMMDLFQNEEPVDILTVKAELQNRNELDAIGGVEYLGALVDEVQVVAHAEEYANIVKDKFLLRSLMQTGVDIVNMCAKEKKKATELLDRASRMIVKISSEGIPSRGFDEIGKVGKQILEELGGGKTRGTVYFGFKELDRKTLGMHPGQLIIVAARPGMGKTTFGVNVCVNVAKQLLRESEGRRPEAICIFSLEMSSEELTRRILAAEANIAMSRLAFETVEECITTRDQQKISEALDRIAKYPILIDSSSSPSVIEMKAKARRIQLERGLALVLVDYLQLMPGSLGMQYRQFEIADISRNLKLMAKDLGVPVIAISQLSRDIEKRTGRSREPRLSDLRDSGAIEQDADLVLFLHSEEAQDVAIENPEVTVKIGKQRNGALGRVKLLFRKKFLQFVEMEKTFGEPVV